jgi:hypothetical protein
MARRGLAIAEEIEHRQGMTARHRALGALYLDLLVLSEAKHHLEQTLASAVNISEERVIPRLWKLRGKALVALHWKAEKMLRESSCFHEKKAVSFRAH